MKEVELGEILVNWLKEHRPELEVYQEIRPSKYAGTSVADVVCVTPENLVWIIEIKSGLNLDVIRQAESWCVDYRSIAIQLPRTISAEDNAKWWLQKINRSWGIGSLIIFPNNSSVPVLEHKAPKLNELSTYESEKFLQTVEGGKTKGFAQAGTAEGGYWTPYKESMIKVREYVVKHPGCGVGDIVNALGKLHYASQHSARTNLVKALNNIEDWCEVRRKGTYDTFYARKDA